MLATRAMLRQAVLTSTILMYVGFSSSPCRGSFVFHGLDSTISWQELADAEGVVLADLAVPGPPKATAHLWAATRDALVEGTEGFWTSGSLLLDEYLPPAYNSPHCKDPKILQVIEVLKGPASLLKRNLWVCGKAPRSPAQQSGRQIVFLGRPSLVVGSLWHDDGGIPELTNAGLDAVRQAIELQAAGQTENDDAVDWTIAAMSHPELRGQIDISLEVEATLTHQQEEVVIQSLLESAPGEFRQLFRMTVFFSRAGSTRVVGLLSSLVEACEGEPEKLVTLLKEYRPTNVQHERYVDKVRRSNFCEEYSSEARLTLIWQDLLSDLSSNASRAQS